MIAVQTTILANLVQNEVFARKVLPFLRSEYFDDIGFRPYRVAYDLISTFFGTYNARPSMEALALDLGRKNDISQADFAATADYIDELYAYSQAENETWLLDTTESFCKRQAVSLAIDKTIEIHSTGKGRDGIPQLWNDTISLSFDMHVGHSYFEDSEKRLDAYHSDEIRIPFGLEWLDAITSGGVPNKSLTCFIAASGVGKTAVMVSLAANHLRLGKNVLYITLEMGEDVPGIGQRLDANLLDVSLGELTKIQKETFRRQIKEIKSKTLGQLFVKEYPTASASVTHFRRLLQELRLKKQVEPDVIFIDYVNICAAARIKPGSDFNSYQYVKYVAEELRGLAVEYEVPVITATQTNRSGYKTMDFDMDSVAESIGLPQTCDLLIALMSNNEHEEADTIQCKQLKNRYGSLNNLRVQDIGFDRSRMRLYDTPLANKPLHKPLTSTKSSLVMMAKEDSPPVKFHGFT